MSLVESIRPNADFPAFLLDALRREDGVERRVVCLYHEGCTDGFTSAWVFRRWVHKHLGQMSDNVDNWHYLPIAYGDQDKLNKVASLIDQRTYVVMLDYCLPLYLMEQLVERSAHTHVIDHHKTSVETLLALDRDQRYHHKFTCHFELKNSGAGLTWKVFHGGAAPLLVRFVEDRDLWVWNYKPYSEPVNAYINSYAYTFDNYDLIEEHIASDFISSKGGRIDLIGVGHNNRTLIEGSAIMRADRKCGLELARSSLHWRRYLDYVFPICNLPYQWHSHTLNELLKDEELMKHNKSGFVASYWDRKDGQRIYSLRSLKGSNVDVSLIAKAQGGGGHAEAAGFQQEVGVGLWGYRVTDIGRE